MMSTSPETRHEHSPGSADALERTSAGGVVVREEAGVEICLIRPTGRRVWGLPKGGVEQGETLAQTAVREVAEETGIHGVVDTALGAITYSFFARGRSQRITKTVHYFLIRATGGDTNGHDHEVSEARWVRLRDALHLMTYQNERDVVRHAAEALGRPLDA